MARSSPLRIWMYMAYDSCLYIGKCVYNVLYYCIIMYHLCPPISTCISKGPDQLHHQRPHHVVEVPSLLHASLADPKLQWP